MDNPGGMAVVLFRSTQGAIRAEHLLQAAGITGKLIPVPRQFSAECGLAFRFPLAQRAQVEAALDRAGLPYQAICVL